MSFENKIQKRLKITTTLLRGFIYAQECLNAINTFFKVPVF